MSVGDDEPGLMHEFVLIAQLASSRTPDDATLQNIAAAEVAEATLSRPRPSLLVVAGTADSLDRVLTLERRLLEILAPVRLHRVELSADGALSAPEVTALVAGHKAGGRIVAGEAAVERQLQRRRIALVVVANDLDAGYRENLSKIFAHVGPDVPIVRGDLGRAELGAAGGVHRAGVVGILRPRPRLAL